MKMAKDRLKLWTQNGYYLDNKQVEVILMKCPDCQYKMVSGGITMVRHILMQKKIDDCYVLDRMNKIPNQDTIIVQFYK